MDTDNQRRQTAIVISALADHTPISRTARIRTIDFRFANSAISRVLIAKHGVDEGLSVLCSVGLLSQSLFLTIVDSSEELFAPVVADLEFFDTFKQRLHLGSYIEIPNSALSHQLQWQAMQILDIEETGTTIGFPRFLRTKTGERRMLWALPINAQELALRKTGINPLLDHIQASDRILVSAQHNVKS